MPLRSEGFVSVKLAEQTMRYRLYRLPLQKIFFRDQVFWGGRPVGVVNTFDLFQQLTVS